MSETETKMIAAVFPGQGSQSVGMGQELFDNFKIYKETLEEASDSISMDFKKLCFNGPEHELMLTKNTQPAIVASSVGAFRVLESEFGFTAGFAAGHSVGEYAALVSSGVLKFNDAIKAVRLRGEAMQESVPVGQGSMAALLGPSDEQVIEICKWVESQNQNWVLEAANFNCPGQVVVSGSSDAVSFLKENISSYELDPKPKKVRVLPLKVSAPFHCKMMKPAQEKMAAFLKDIEFSKPQLSLIQNVTAKNVVDPDQIRENLTNQISGSVLWSKSVNFMMDEGVKTFVEVGSGTTLSGLIKKIISSENQKILNTSNLDSLKHTSDALK